MRTLGKFGKLADFVLVLDGDSRAMENRLKAVAEEYGHALQPLFLPGDAPPERWIWDIVRRRPERYAAEFGLAVPDMRKMTDRVAHLVEGAVQQRDAAKAALGTFAEEVKRAVPGIARIVGKREAGQDAIPELVVALKEQIGRWRNL